MTEGTARAIGQDAANARMRKAGRKVWNRADYRLAIETFRRLWPPLLTSSDLDPFTPAVLDHIQKVIDHA